MSAMAASMALNSCFEIGFSRSKAGRIRRAKHELRAIETAVADKGIATHGHIRKGLLRGLQRGRDLAFRLQHLDVRGEHLAPRPELRCDGIEHRLHHDRDARHDDHVLQTEAGRDRDLVLDEAGTMRNTRHAQPCRCRLDTATRVILEHERFDLGMMIDRHAEGLGDTVGRDVVVRRADAAGREDIGVTAAQLVDGVDDLVLEVADDTHLFQADTDHRAVIGDRADILILRAS